MSAHESPDECVSDASSQLSSPLLSSPYDDSEENLYDIEDLNLANFTIRSKSKRNFNRYHWILICKLYLIMSTLVFFMAMGLFFMAGQSVQTSTTKSNLLYNQVTNILDEETNGTESKFVRTFGINLDPNNQCHLSWTVDYDDESLLFEVKYIAQATFDWFAIGFSSYGQYTGADLCLFWYDPHRRIHLDNVHTDNGTFLLVNPKNHCHFIKAKRNGKHIWFAFRRKFDTCDRDGYIIDEGTTHLVYSSGRGPLNRVEGMRLKDYPATGFQRVQLLKLMEPMPRLSKEVKTIEFLAGNITIPSDETTYWCHVQKLPDDFGVKIHVLQYESAILPTSEGVVHHMELFHCEVKSDAALPDWNGSCNSPAMPPELKACKRVVAAWAFGAGPMIYPKNVGLPVGGQNYSRYMMLEVHYNNPEHKSGLVDDSGIRLYYTNKLRPIDAGILEIGLEYTDKNSIPPGVVMDLHGYCTPECTRVGLPPYGITVFASQLHTHLTGVRAWTRRVRGGLELPELNRDNHYSPHFQEIRKLKRPTVIFPGDGLISTCRYDTHQRKKMTLGGFGIQDEMCVSYVHYYPKVNLEVCKSSIDTDYLNKYFEYMRTNERQNTSAAYSVKENFYNIQWSKARAEMLEQVYLSSPLSMQCNQSSGERFPGYWNGVPTTKVYRPLPKPERKCRMLMTDYDDGDDDDGDKVAVDQLAPVDTQEAKLKIEKIDDLDISNEIDNFVINKRKPESPVLLGDMAMDKVAAADSGDNGGGGADDADAHPSSHGHRSLGEGYEEEEAREMTMLH